MYSIKVIQSKLEIIMKLKKRHDKLILYVRCWKNPTKISKQLLESGIEIRYIDLD